MYIRIYGLWSGQIQCNKPFVFLLTLYLSAGGRGDRESLLTTKLLNLLRLLTKSIYLPMVDWRIAHVPVDVVRRTFVKPSMGTLN